MSNAMIKILPRRKFVPALRAERGNLVFKPGSARNACPRVSVAGDRKRFHMKAAVFTLLILLALSTYSYGAEAGMIRAFHIPLSGARDKAYIMALIDKLDGKFNTLVIQVNNKVLYESYPEIASSEGESMLEIRPGPAPMSKKDLREIVEYARKKGIDVIPEVKFLTHQEKFLRRRHPELMYNEVTYDPRNPKVYKLAFSVIDELIEVIKPRYFHIGHDEMREFSRRKADADSNIPSYKEFADDANTLAAYLKKKGVIPMMWGDMLLDPVAFRGVSEKMFKSMHGGLQDYHKAIDLLDRDIIIVDWHYGGGDTVFPTADYFLSKGFKVVGSTFKDGPTTASFAAYLCSGKKPGVAGMMATSWQHFIFRETPVIDSIIDVSARAYSKCK